MASKQGKLAAARKKLKEFQVKNKEMKPNDVVTSRSSKDDSCLSGDSRNSPLSQSVSPVNLSPSLLTYQENRGQNDKENQRKISTESNTRLGHYSSPEKLNDSQHVGNSSVYGAFNESPNFGSINQNHKNTDGISCNNVKSLDPIDFFNMASADGFNDVIKPLQHELENHAQTINILVQQKNEVQSALTQAHALLNKNSGEIEELNQQIVFLTTSVTHANKRLKEAEEFSQRLLSEKEEYFQKWKETLSYTDQLQLKLESKEEEFLELRKKYEEKSNESHRLLFSLQEAQSQLSLTQIQAQQFSAEGQTALAIQVSDLQKENLTLKHKAAELEKSLECERVEKEESSQKFHVYAQQCNIQLANLNSQLKILRSENEKLSEVNESLLKNLSELEGENEKNVSRESYETEIADLHDQLSALKEKTNRLEMDLSIKKEESIYLKEELEVKDAEQNQLETIIRELEEENKKLLMEAETPKASEKLLATMESDKVAAAKAVSQNVKLKEQIVELEEAFMKLSQEKLQLTDKLAHEKHIRSELEKRLQHEESDHDKTKCHHGKDEHEPLVNDSDEIEELRNIVRQLQDDKMELTARLNVYETSRTEDKRKNECEHSHDYDHEHKQEHDDTDCENAKLRLQQMEEKVRRTMNEIAILDEEKEKLEHLVLQLQGETETIGEYITLYQRQRMVLKQKAQEKDIRLMQLSQDKEELKSKLAFLDDLVQRLIAERDNIYTQPGPKIPVLNSSSGAYDNTVGKIRALISEIRTTNLVANQSGVFEHCSCCSGRLITI